MATKNSSNSLSPLTALFDNAPYMVPSKFELDTFHPTTTSASFARRVIEVVNEIRELESTKPTTEFQRKNIAANIAVLQSWLENYDADKLVDLVTNWEDKESSYWIDTLGKRAAIEIIAENKISKETMEKMTMLPEPDYIKATQLCVKLANAIKSATVKAEEAIGVVAPPPLDPVKDEVAAKKGFNLKKL